MLYTPNCLRNEDDSRDSPTPSKTSLRVPETGRELNQFVLYPNPPDIFKTKAALAGTRTGALPRRHVRTRRVASAQHRSHQGSGPSPEISHRNRVYLSDSAQDPECWTSGGCRIGPTISPGSIANLTVSTAWNLLPWRGLIFENAPTGRTSQNVLRGQGGHSDMIL